ncbi:hypothetical protein BO221_42720 [Archangium sp. Cb G35]|uniref:hypothetical protein n=1 Tax=Archangium sp. Cb G35 TaxID=1920190 RepID=UPI0009368BC1|nr:hypothetical protein [Archangium sp. Cb G35]OJT18193.1 hypothetical protein BO221_42720 [Archangium sp. Cb G35]
MSSDTIDNLIAQMQQNQEVLNGWDLVINLVAKPIAHIMNLPAVDFWAWRMHVAISYCQALPNPDGEGQLALYTVVDIVLQEPEFHFPPAHPGMANIEFEATGQLRLGSQVVAEGFVPARDANADAAAIRWKTTELGSSRFAALVPMSIVEGQMVGLADGIAVVMDFPSGSFNSPAFAEVQDNDRLQRELRTYFASHNASYQVAKLPGKLFKSLPSLFTSFKLNTLETNSGKRVLQLFLSAQPDPPSLSMTLHVNEPVPDSTDFSLIMSRQTAVTLADMLSTGSGFMIAAWLNLLLKENARAAFQEALRDSPRENQGTAYEVDRVALPGNNWLVVGHFNLLVPLPGV